MKAIAFVSARLSILGAVIALIGGCAALYDTSDPIAGLAPGATKVEVTAALGAPARIVTKGDREAWLYCRESELLDRFVLAVFKDSALESVDQDLEFEFGPCKRLFDGVALTGAGG
ncbi:MAG: hypothetical protein R3174_08255 [Gammaproteobacteria bacterium]|nr:hypothetical protein [Gammaproteobacteria bacterium]